MVQPTICQTSPFKTQLTAEKTKQKRNVYVNLLQKIYKTLTQHPQHYIKVCK